MRSSHELNLKLLVARMEATRSTLDASLQPGLKMGRFGLNVELVSADDFEYINLDGLDRDHMATGK